MNGESESNIKFNALSGSISRGTYVVLDGWARATAESAAHDIRSSRKRPGQKRAMDQSQKTKGYSRLLQVPDCLLTPPVIKVSCHPPISANPD